MVIEQAMQGLSAPWKLDQVSLQRLGGSVEERPRIARLKSLVPNSGS